MEATLENITKAMQLCAKAHNAEFKDWSEEGQLGIKSESVPVMADVQMIADAFFTDAYVNAKFGYTTLWFGCDVRENVDVDTLGLALPNGWIDKIK